MVAGSADPTMWTKWLGIVAAASLLGNAAQGIERLVHHRRAHAAPAAAAAPADPAAV